MDEPSREHAPPTSPAGAAEAELWTVGQAADRAGVPHVQLIEWIRRGRLEATVGGREGVEVRLVRAADVAALVPGLDVTAETGFAVTGVINAMSRASAGRGSADGVNAEAIAEAEQLKLEVSALRDEIIGLQQLLARTRGQVDESASLPAIPGRGAAAEIGDGLVAAVAPDAEQTDGGVETTAVDPAHVVPSYTATRSTGDWRTARAIAMCASAFLVGVLGAWLWLDQKAVGVDSATIGDAADSDGTVRGAGLAPSKALVAEMLPPLESAPSAAVSDSVSDSGPNAGSNSGPNEGPKEAQSKRSAHGMAVRAPDWSTGAGTPSELGSGRELPALPRRPGWYAALAPKSSSTLAMGAGTAGTDARVVPRAPIPAAWMRGSTVSSPSLANVDEATGASAIEASASAPKSRTYGRRWLADVLVAQSKGDAAANRKSAEPCAYASLDTATEGIASDGIAAAVGPCYGTDFLPSTEGGDPARSRGTHRVDGVACCAHHAFVERMTRASRDDRALRGILSDAASSAADGVVPPLVRLRAERTAVLFIEDLVRARPFDSGLAAGGRASTSRGVGGAGLVHQWDPITLPKASARKTEGASECRLQLTSWVVVREGEAPRRFEMVITLSSKPPGDLRESFRWLEDGTNSLPGVGTKTSAKR